MSPGSETLLPAASQGGSAPQPLPQQQKHKEKQQTVVVYIRVGLAVTIVGLGACLLGCLPELAKRLLPADAPMADRLALAVRWDVLVHLSLFAAIIRVAMHRLASPEDIDAAVNSRDSDKARMLQAILQNTVEQSVMGIGAHLAWAASMPPETMAAIPFACTLFAVGRVLFSAGYADGVAFGRGMGFALTMMPTAGMLACTAAKQLLDAFFW